MERERNLLNIINTVAILGGIFFVSQLAFSRKVRKEIGQKNNWTCQADDCDKSFATGWMVHASHDPEHHHKSDPKYDHPSSGDIRCIEHHLEQHLEGTTLKPHQDDYAVRQLEQTEERAKWWLDRHR